HGMAGNPRAGPALRVARVVDRLADILVLVVEPGVDLVKAAVLRPALGEIRPALDPLPRRAAGAAAGEGAQAVEAHRLRLEPELETANFARIGPLLRVRARHRQRQQDGAAGETRNARDARHFFMGSHSRVSLPQKSTQSS